MNTNSTKFVNSKLISEQARKSIINKDKKYEFNAPKFINFENEIKLNSLTNTKT